MYPFCFWNWFVQSFPHLISRLLSLVLSYADQIHILVVDLLFLGHVVLRPQLRREKRLSRLFFALLFFVFMLSTTLQPAANLRNNTKAVPNGHSEVRTRSNEIGRMTLHQRDDPSDYAVNQWFYSDWTLFSSELFGQGLWITEDVSRNISSDSF